jgi:hypothetical protein
VSLQSSLRYHTPRCPLPPPPPPNKQETTAPSGFRDSVALEEGEVYPQRSALYRRLLETAVGKKGDRQKKRKTEKKREVHKHLLILISSVSVFPFAQIGVGIGA